MSLETDLLGAAVDVVESQRQEIERLKTANAGLLNSLSQARDWVAEIGDDSDWKLDQLDVLDAAIGGEAAQFRHPISQVYFRAGLIACREYMARFVEAESPTIAASIRANWWPSLGDDLGAPRKIEWGEVTEGEYGTEAFRCKKPNEISPTVEALPVALAFLIQHCGYAYAEQSSHPAHGDK